MASSPGLDLKVREKLYKAYKDGESILQISLKTKLPYITVYYYIRRKGLLSTVKKYNKVEDRQFDYKSYLQALWEYCIKESKLSEEEFSSFSKTEKGENFIMVKAVMFTPSIWTRSLEKKKKLRRISY